MPALALLLLLLLPACEEPQPFETRIVLIVDPDNDPLADAATITVRLRLVDGSVVEDSRAIEGTEFRLEGLERGDVDSLEVEVRGGDNAISGLGRSQAFELGPEGVQAAVFVGAADAISRVPRSLTEARTYARGAWIPGGRVVVVGGGDNVDETIGAVEFVGWDPKDPMVAVGGADLPRIGHGVAYVPEGEGAWGGRVAVFGGTFGAGDDTLNGGWQNAAASISLIDPASGTVERDVAPLDRGYMDFRTVVTADGLIALIGGYGQVGETELPYTDRVVLLDPALGEQVEGPAMPAGSNREQHAAVAFEAQGNDFVLVTGGYIDGAGRVTRDLLWSGRASDAPVLLTRTDDPDRSRHQATDLGTGQILITGGAAGMTGVFDDGQSLDTAELFDPALDGGTFTPVASAMADARQRHVAARIPGGRVLVCGGLGDGGAALTTCEVFTLDTGLFTPFPSSVNPGGPGMTAVPADDGRVFLFGGATGLGPSDALHVYTPPRWSADGA
jgi:hypothetical protein